MSISGKRLAHVHGIVTTESEFRVLLVPAGESLALPSFTISDDGRQIDTAEVSSGFRDILGYDINVLYRMSFEVDEATNSSESIFVIEDRSRSDNGYYWFSLDDVEKLPLSRPEHRGIIIKTLKTAANDTLSIDRAPWTRPGWLTAVANWLDEEMHQQGLGRVSAGSLVPVKNWSLAYVSRIPTGQGSLYFKSARDLPLFVNEAEILAELNTIFPGKVPVVRAAHSGNRWLLMEDVGEIVDWDAAAETRLRILKEVARIQQDAVRHLEHLLNKGCHNRRPDTLAEAFLLVANSHQINAALDDHELAKVSVLQDRIPELAARLGDYAIPETLVHGDLHCGNVGKKEEKFIIFDWTDACVAHPFFDVLDIHLEKDKQLQLALRDHYLSLWSKFESSDRLLEAWQIGSVLAAVHHAVSYHSIVANIEPAARADLDWGPPFWMRKALLLLEELDENDDC